MSSSSAASAPNVELAAPHPDTIFALSAQAGGDKRELLSGDRAAALLQPLTADAARAEKVHTLSLQGKSFGSDSAPHVATALQSTHALRHADFSDSIAGRNTDEALDTLQLLCDGIAANNRIQLSHLDLSNNALGVRGIPRIRNAFKNQSELVHLFFNNDGLESDAVTALTKLIMENYPNNTTALRSFEIGHNCMQDDGFLALIPLIEASPLLQTLRISTTRVQNDKGAGLAMAKALLSLKHLTSLSINDNNLGGEAGPVLAQVIRNNASHLSHLNLGDIGVQEHGVEAVIKAIAEIKPNTITHLDLSANELTASSKHAGLLARIVLRQAGSLQHLKLEDNELKSRGTIRLLRALHHCRKLSYLNLTNNQLGPRSAESVLKFLGSMPQLRELHLNGNHFRAATLQHIKDAVAKDTKLETMSDNEEESDEEEDEESEGDDEEDEAPAAAPDAEVDALAAGLAATKVEQK